jgi:hypothetical protein
MMPARLGWCATGDVSGRRPAMLVAMVAAAAVLGPRPDQQRTP